MNEQAFFNLDTNAEPEKDVRERIFFLNSMLNKHGIWFDLVYDSEDRQQLLVRVNPGMLKRHAGKHTQEIYIPDTTSKIGKHVCTVDEIRKMEAAAMTTSVIADLIRISKSTYFRRKKTASGKNG